MKEKQLLSTAQSKTEPALGFQLWHHYYDDSRTFILLHEGKETELLTFSSDCVIYHEGKAIGRFNLRDSLWEATFQYKDYSVVALKADKRDVDWRQLEHLQLEVGKAFAKLWGGSALFHTPSI